MTGFGAKPGIAAAIANLADFPGVKADWQSTLGGTLTGGSPALTNSAQAFVQADVGKHVLIKLDAGTIFHSTILSVNGSGVATLAANAPSVATNQRVRWGTDSGPGITAALAVLAADSYPVREAYLPAGMWCITQITMPRRIKFRGAGWGNYGPTINNVSGWQQAVGANTLIWQLPGVNDDAIFFTDEYYDATHNKHWVGPVELSDFLLSGPERNLAGGNMATGSGIACRVAGGGRATAEDGFVIERVQVTGFPQDGFSFPGGALPLSLRACRAYFNGRYGFNFIDADAYDTQAIHLLDFSADGNSEGAARFKSVRSFGALNITSLKSEKADTYPTMGGNKQESALIFEDCDQTPVVINGLTHISSMPGGAATEAPGPAISIIGTGVPRIVYNAVGVRVVTPATDTNVANAVVLRDSVNSIDVSRKQPHGLYPALLNVDRIATGEETVLREVLNSDVTMSSGTLRLAHFTARKTEDITSVRLRVKTAAGATPTLCRIAVYSEDASGNLTLITATANDTSLFTGTAPFNVTKALAATWSKKAGYRYVIGVLCVTGASAPAITGFSGNDSSEMAVLPKVNGAFTGQTDIPSSIAVGSIGASTLKPYAVLVP